jgi:predicted nuclease with TOPRIM domain
MPVDTEDIKRQFERSLAELETLRDEARVRVHLGTMELKDKLRELEARLDDLKQQRSGIGQELRDQVAELRNAFRALRDRLG